MRIVLHIVTIILMFAFDKLSHQNAEYSAPMQLVVIAAIFGNVIALGVAICELAERRKV